MAQHGIAACNSLRKGGESWWSKLLRCNSAFLAASAVFWAVNPSGVSALGPIAYRLLGGVWLEKVQI